MTEQSVGVIGVGRLGSDVAFTLAERDLCDIVLYDKDADRAAYLASDLSDTSFGHAYNRRISWTPVLGDLSRCSVILIAAGARAENDGSQGELFRRNRAIAEEIAETFRGSSNLFVVASDPVELMTAALTRLLQVPTSRVMGIGGVVDSYRVRFALGEQLSVNPDFVRSQVIGTYGTESHLLWEYSSVNGIPARELMSAEAIDQTVSIVDSEAHSKKWLMSHARSRYTPAIACLELLRSLVLDDRRILSVTVTWSEILGISGVAMSLPCVVGRFGAERPIVPDVDASVRAQLSKSAKEMAAILEEAGT